MKKKDLKSVDIPRLLKTAQEREEKEYQELIKRSKPLEDCYIDQKFVVADVYTNQEATTITPESEIHIGGRSPAYQSGFTCTTRITVRPSKSPVEELVFNGYTPAMPGQTIEARILAYDEHKDPRALSQLRRGRSIYTLRTQLKKEEEAIAITIRFPKQGIRVDKSVRNGHQEPEEGELDFG